MFYAGELMIHDSKSMNRATSFFTAEVCRFVSAVLDAEGVGFEKLCMKFCMCTASESRLLDALRETKPDLDLSSSLQSSQQPEQLEERQILIIGKRTHRFSSARPVEKPEQSHH